MTGNSPEPIPAAHDPASLRVRPASHVVAAKQEGRTILLDLRGGRYYSLEGVGGRIWAMLQDEMELPQIEAQLARDYEAPRERIARDLHALLETLRGKGLVS